MSFLLLAQRIDVYKRQAIGLPQQGGNLLGEVGAVVHHRQQYAVDLELGVDLPLHLVYGLEQLFQALGGQVLRLNGDYDPVGGGQGVDLSLIHI